MIRNRLVTAFGVGGLLLAGLAVAARAADEPRPQPKAEASKPLNKMVLSRHGRFVMLDGLDPKTAKVILEPGKGEAIIQPDLSPDGKKVAYVTFPDAPPTGEEPKPEPMRVMVCDADGKNAKEVATTHFGAAWANSGEDLFVLDVDLKTPPPKGKQPGFTAALVNVVTKQTTALPVAEGHMPFGLTPDGKGLLTQVSGADGWKPTLSIAVASLDGKTVKKLTDPAYLAYNGFMLPDGKAVVYAGDQLPDKPVAPVDNNIRVFIQPVGGKATELPGFPKSAALKSICCSPDGKQIAYIWRQVHKEPVEEGKADERETLSHLCVCDLDGRNHRTILTEKGKGPEETLSSLSWR